MAAYRLIHISDLHFYDRQRGGHDRSLVESAAKWVYDTCRSGEPEVDAIVVSGDLVEFGGKKPLALAREYLDSPPNTTGREPYLNDRRNPTLQAAGVPIFVVPGNHDRWVRRKTHVAYGAGVGAASLNFDRALSRYWNQGHNAIQIYQIPKGAETLVLLAVDATLSKESDAQGQPRLFAVMGQGNVDPKVIEALVDHTRFYTENGAAVAWLIHFPPRFYEHFPARLDQYLKLIGEDALLIAAQKSRVRLLLSGHTHQAQFYRDPIASDTHIQCAGSTGKYSGSIATAHTVDIDVQSGTIVGTPQIITATCRDGDKGFS